MTTQEFISFTLAHSFGNTTLAPTPERNPMGNYSGEQVDYTKGVPLLFAKIRERLTSEEHREEYVKLRRDVYFILADERLRQ